MASRGTVRWHAHPQHTILSVMDHFLCYVDLVTIEHVAFGPDTLYGDHVQLHTVFGAVLKIGDLGGLAFEKVEYVDGLENPTQNFTNIVRWLEQPGFSDADIEAALDGNIMRALGAIWV